MAVQRKTANLFSIDMAHDDYSTLVYHYTISGLTPNNQYTCSSNFVQSGSSASIWFGGTSTGTNGVSDGNPKTMTSNANGEIDLYINHNTGNAYSQVVNGTAWVMVNEGSTALPYEPYGWVHSLRKLETSTDTITTLPAEVIADGQSATVGLQGNMSQNGTPTPQNPIEPSETGDKTGNLFDKNATDESKGYISQNRYLRSNGNTQTPSGETVWHVSEYIDVHLYDYVTFSGLTGGSSSPSMCFYDSNYDYISGVSYNSKTEVTAEVPSTASYIRVSFSENRDYMLNTGSTALPYEPYGFKIPISSGNTTTPVYLGEVQSTRQIYKTVLTGQESWSEYGTGTGHFYYIALSPFAMVNLYPVCTHYLTIRVASEGKQLRIYETYESITDFTNYLQQQYAAGTPVTVWYVLANETTGIVNEPIRKIGDYADTVSGVTVPTTGTADTFDVLTTLKPSEVELTYTGWHPKSDHKF